MQKKNVLIVISAMGQFPEMFRIAEILKNSEEFNPVVYFNLGIYPGHPNVAFCLDSGIDVLDYNFGYVESRRVSLQEKPVFDVIQEQQLQIQVENGPNLKLKELVKQKLPEVFKWIKATVHFVYMNLHLLGIAYRVGVKVKRLRKERTFLGLTKPALMLFGEDSEDYFTPQLIKLGHEIGVKSVVFPYTFANQYEFLEDAHFNDRRVNRNFLNFVVGKAFPKWTYQYNGKNLLKSSPSLILSSELFKAAPPNPWVMSSGFADVIAVESQYMKDYYREAGIPDQQMLETGYPSLDQISQIHTRRADFRKAMGDSIGLDPKKPWVVCAVPPSQWPRAAVGFKSYSQFLREFIQYFSKFTDVEVIFKFHPRLDANDVKKLCDQHKIKFVFEDTATLVALSDAYIASSSSTMRWSLALGVPTINYDAYNYNYGDFKHGKNFDVVVKFEEFQDVFKKLHAKLICRKESTECSFQKDFAVLDGKAHQRILELFQKLTKTSEHVQ